MLKKGHQANGARRTVTPELVDQFRRMREDGLSNVAIGHYLSLSRETVRAYLNGSIKCNS